MLNDNMVLLPVKSDPTVSIKIWFKVGAQNDPKGKEGLAYITARLISEGSTIDQSYEQILENLFPLAACYSADSSMEMTIYSGRVHIDNLESYYPIFINGILHPAFCENELRRIKDAAINYLYTTLKYSDDEELGKAVLYNSIFQNTPYGHIVEGTVSGINNITIDDVRYFYKKYYCSNNLVIGIAGNFPQSLIKRLSGDLKRLPYGETAGYPEIHCSPINGINVIIVEKESETTAISIGFPINILRGSKEWYALSVANSWFGEHRNSSSHLYQVIREARGLNYGDYSYIEHFPGSSTSQIPQVNVSRRYQIFEIWVRQVANENSHFVLRAVLREMKHLVDNGMTQENFEQTRKFLKKYVFHFAPDIDTRLGYALDDKFYELEKSHLEEFRNMMDKLTLTDVNDAIRRHLQYENMKIVFVTGNALALNAQLVNNLISPAVYHNSKNVAICSEDREIENYKINILNSNVEIINAGPLLISAN